MPTGTVDWYHPKHKRGAVVLDNDGGEAFFDVEALRRAGLETVQRGQRLSFGVRRDPQSRRLVADNLVVLEERSRQSTTGSKR
jgi:CspA family cold shock protein